MDRNNSAWSDLPQEILGCIMEHLCFVDRVRFRAVCKTWRPVKPNDEKFPWLLMFETRRVFDKIGYYLYNLRHGKAHAFEDRLLKHHQSCLWPLARLRCAHVVRSGWVFVEFRCCGLFSLYNTFTQQVINLPKMPVPEQRRRRHTNRLMFTFSCGPGANRFVVCCVDRRKLDKLDKEFLVTTWSSGDEEWRTDSFRLGVDPIGRVTDLVCVGEILYSVFRTGAVVAFDTAGRTWRSSSTVVDVEFDNNDNISQVVGCEEELFLVRSRCGSSGGPELRVARLDRPLLSWVEEASLGKKVLFCMESRPFGRSLLMVSAGAGGGFAKDFAGRVCCRKSGSNHFDLFEYNNADRVGFELGFEWPEKEIKAIWTHPPAL